MPETGGKNHRKKRLAGRSLAGQRLANPEWSGGTENRLPTMNVYLIIDRLEKSWYVKATTSDAAERIVLAHGGACTSCWFIASSLPRGATVLSS